MLVQFSSRYLNPQFFIISFSKIFQIPKIYVDPIVRQLHKAQMNNEPKEYSRYYIVIENQFPKNYHYSSFEAHFWREEMWRIANHTWLFQ